MCLVLLAFADDCVCLSESREGLEEVMSAAYDYCNRWDLRINFTKTKAMIFTTSDGNVIEQVDKFKYLGVTLFTNGNWHRTQKKLAQQGEKAIMSMRALQCCHYQNPVDKVKDYECLVEPIPTYACQAWGSHKAPDILRVASKYHKQLLGVRKGTPEYMWTLDLGVVPIMAKINYRMVSFCMVSFWATLMKPEKTHGQDVKVYL